MFWFYIGKILREQKTSKSLLEILCFVGTLSNWNIQTNIKNYLEQQAGDGDWNWKEIVDAIFEHKLKTAVEIWKSDNLRVHYY